MFIGAVFTIAKTQKQTKYPSTEEWIKKMWDRYVCVYIYIYTHTHTHTQWNIAAAAKSLQSCPTLCDPIDGGPPGSPVPGILQARTLEWVAISFSNAWKGKVKVKSRPHGLQPTRVLRPWDCLTLYNLMDYRPPGSSTHGILQARVLEWDTIVFPNSGILFSH